MISQGEDSQQFIAALSVSDEHCKSIASAWTIAFSKGEGLKPSEFPRCLGLYLLANTQLCQHNAQCFYALAYCTVKNSRFLWVSEEKTYPTPSPQTPQNGSKRQTHGQPKLLLAQSPSWLMSCPHTVYCSPCKCAIEDLLCPPRHCVLALWHQDKKLEPNDPIPSTCEKTLQQLTKMCFLRLWCF